MAQNRDGLGGPRVSILVFLELALGPSSLRKLTPEEIKVSILVFLELALGHWSPKTTIYRDWSFNPCFLGTCPRTQNRIASSVISSTVSILVFLELALGRLMNFAMKIFTNSFNPCFLGTCPRTTSNSSGIFRHLMFQSLFSWNLPSDEKMRAISTSRKRFNPCFLGTCPRTVYSTHGRMANGKFQSLFSWNLPSDLESQIKRDGCLDPVFQSLFSWNLPSDSETCLPMGIGLGFQSLFSWNLPSDSGCKRHAVC